VDDFLLRNGWQIFTGVMTLLVTVAMSFAVFKYKVISLQGDHIKIHSRIDDVEAALLNHRLDTERHIDPRRDEQRWRDLYKRLDTIERKVDELHQ